MSVHRIHKFGGASVKDADGVKNLLNVLKHYEDESLCVVVSAMGKTTNALEQVVNAFYSKSGDATLLLSEVKKYHVEIIEQLFPNENIRLKNEVENIFVELLWAIEEAQIKSYDYEYDQIVSMGEQLSTRIVAAYLNENGYKIQWVDARDLIRTDTTFREAKIEWKATIEQVNSILEIQNSISVKRYITQGFIGGTSENFTTTLGREGSDFTASILAFATNAVEVIIWKDVPGVLNADPRVWPAAVLLSELSYYDAIELTYYGATVIHPKTIKPLQNKGIPLRVKSFLDPHSLGTLIGEKEVKNNIPCYIFKEHQRLLSISARDFSFIVEGNIQDIFSTFSLHRIKVNLMQQSALSFSVCVTAEENRWRMLLDDLELRYKLKYNDSCELITIRNYIEPLPIEITEKGEVLLEQRSRNTLQLVVKSKNYA
jgi:aspartate kinase